MNICIVEDNQLVRRYVSASLEDAGHRIVEAGNGDEALRAIEIQPPDLVITDIIMPDKEGIELIAEIRKRQPSTRIIAMSGGGAIDSGTYLDIADAAGANAYLQKPFLGRELIDTVDKVMRDTPSPRTLDRCA